MMQKVKPKHILYGVLIIFLITLKNSYYLDISTDSLKETYANEHSKFIEIDSMQVHYRDEGKGFPIVLIHGVGSSLHTWNDWAKELKKNYRVIRMDLPAFGITGPNKNRDYSIKNYTNFLHQFLEKMNIKKVHLAGSSLGGNISWNYAAEHPEKTEKLILVSSSGLRANKDLPIIFKLARMPFINKLFLRITSKYFIKRNIKEVYADDSKITDSLVERYHKMALREGNRQAFIDRANYDFNPEIKKSLEKLKSVKTPTLLIWGAQDKWIPLENGKRMDSILTNSKLSIIENSGHVAMEENPEESLKLVLEFMNNII